MIKRKCDICGTERILSGLIKKNINGKKVFVCLNCLKLNTGDKYERRY